MIKFALISGKTADDSFSSNCSNIILVILNPPSYNGCYGISLTLNCVNGYSKISYYALNLENNLISFPLLIFNSNKKGCFVAIFFNIKGYVCIYFTDVEVNDLKVMISPFFTRGS